MKKGIIFINGHLGLKILDFLYKDPEFDILAVVVNATVKRRKGYIQEILNLTNPSIRIFETSRELWQDIDFIQVTKLADFGISSLYGHVIPAFFIENLEFKILNLHPSLLPIGRGSDPIPWTIIEGKKHGITLHEITSELDEGPIIFQRELAIDMSMTAGAIYNLSINKLFEDFTRIFQNWVDGKILGTKQKSEPTYHKTADLFNLRKSLAKDATHFEYLIRVLRALSFSNNLRPILKFSDGIAWEVEVIIKRHNNLEEEINDL